MRSSMLIVRKDVAFAKDDPSTPRYPKIDPISIIFYVLIAFVSHSNLVDGGE